MSDSNYGTGEPQPLGTIEWNGYRFSELNEQDIFYFEEKFTFYQYIGLGFAVLAIIFIEMPTLKKMFKF